MVQDYQRCRAVMGMDRHSRCRAAKAALNSPEAMPEAEAAPHLDSPEAVNSPEAVSEVEAVPQLNSPEAVTEGFLLVFVSQLGHSASVLDSL